MNDRMDEWLSRLPGEQPASDLAIRIMGAVASRRRARVHWRHMGILAFVGLAVGAGLVVVSWADVGSFVALHVASTGATGFSQIVESYLASPMETVSGGIQSILSLQTSMAEGIGAAFLLGVVLLAIAAFGGIARLLRPSPPANGYSHLMGR